MGRLETELAWAAGFFDGEGCSCVQKRAGGKRAGISLQISQNNTENLERFLAAVGQGGIRGPHISKTSNSKPSWRWGCYSKSGTHAVMKQLWPYLGIHKKKQYLLARETVKQWAG